VLRFLLALIRRTPLAVLHASARPLACVAMRVVRYRRRVAEANLAAAFPALSRRARLDLLRASYRNLVTVVLETLKTDGLTDAQLDSHVRLVNVGILDRFAAAGQSIILLGAHEANWEWVFLACSRRLEFAVDLVYKPLHDAVIDELMRRTRARFGASLIPSGREVFKELIAGGTRLRAIGLQVDQRPGAGSESRSFRFLNRDTPFLVGFEKLARYWQYPVVFVGRRRTARGRYEVAFEVLAEPPYAAADFELTRRYVERLERSVLENPADWLWTHDRWRGAR
jgi:KDO2-lipid IV(A) lauroyltransferase